MSQCVTNETFAEGTGLVEMGGKCEFTATAQQSCQFVKSGLPSDGDFFRDAAWTHDRSEPSFDIRACAANDRLCLFAMRRSSL